MFRFSHVWIATYLTFNYLQEMKLAKTICIVVAFFIVTWLPFSIVVIALNYQDHFTINLTNNEKSYLAYFVKCLQYSGSAVNPLIYAKSLPAFSDVFKDLSGRFQSRGHVSHRQSNHLRSTCGTINTQLNYRSSTSVEMLVVTKEITGQSPTMQVIKNKSNLRRQHNHVIV